MPRAPANPIAVLNDRFRATFAGGKVVMTQGVAALSEAERLEALDAVRRFDAFSEDNDPHGERDFGAFDVAGCRLYFKIDYYDPTMTYGSDDPADPEKTVRVLTIMLAEEY